MTADCHASRTRPAVECRISRRINGAHQGDELPFLAVILFKLWRKLIPVVRCGVDNDGRRFSCRRPHAVQESLQCPIIPPGDAGFQNPVRLEGLNQVDRVLASGLNRPGRIGRLDGKPGAFFPACFTSRCKPGSASLAGGPISASVWTATDATLRVTSGFNAGTSMPPLEQASPPWVLASGSRRAGPQTREPTHLSPAGSREP